MSAEGVDGAVIVVCPEQKWPLDSISLDMNVSSLCPSSPVRSMTSSSSAFVETTLALFLVEYTVSATYERSLILMSG